MSANNQVSGTTWRNHFDGGRLKQLFQDKRFISFLSIAGVCLILIGYYFIHHSRSDDETSIKSTNNLNADIPNASDSTGLPARSKLELAGDAKALAMPDQATTERGLNANVPGTVVPDRSRRREADAYIYSEAIPQEIDDYPDMEAPRTQKGARRGHSNTPNPDFSFNIDNDDPQKTKDQLEKEKKLLALLQEYKADKLKRQQEIQNRLLKPETYSLPTVSSLTGPTGKNTFYGLESEMRQQTMDDKEDSLSITIKAMVFSEQTVVSGGRVTLRLLENISLRGRLIPEGTLLYGVANFSGQRVHIAINQVQFEGRILPLKLTVYDMDGLAGVYVPNVTGLQQGRQAIAQAGQGFTVSPPIVANNIPSMATVSAIQAGLQGGRNFLSRKMTLPKATLKNNYYVLLK